MLKLNQQPGTYIVKYGTGILDRTLLEHDLIDTLRTYPFPVATGAGPNLFETHTNPQHIGLAEVVRFKTGTLVLA